MQSYLAAYAERFGLAPRLRLGTEVVAAELDETEQTWTLETADVTTGTPRTDTFDHLVVANGVYCEPLVPAFTGAEEHAEGGGRILHTSRLRDLDEARGRHVLVVGYGKSACDVAEAVSDVAASTTVVARQLLWKVPRRVAGVLNYKYLVLTRLGEALFGHPQPRGAERLLHLRRFPLGPRMLGALRAVAVRQDRLADLGLVPDGPFERIARSTASMTTDGFFAKVRRGEIAVHRDAEVTRLVADNQPLAELTDGARVPADLVLCGTGFRQRVSFLGEEVQGRITDRRGNFELYRHVLPVDVPHLTFAGYNSSFFSPLSAEIAALWTASLLRGDLRLPSADEMRAQIGARLRWMEQRTDGRHARGASIIPFSMRNVDEMLADIGLDASPLTRLRQWLLPVDPRAYRAIEPRLVARRSPRDAREVRPLAPVARGGVDAALRLHPGPAST
jgi:dimethylaniline monooxygenase (N-oxide forming)